MKRTALLRRTPLRRVTPSLDAGGPRANNGLTRSAPMKRSRMVRRPKRKRDDADPARLEWIRDQPCCAPGCDGTCGPVEAHHHSLDGAGMGRKAPDDKAMPLGRDHHTPGLHAMQGPFRGWTKAELKAWQDEKVAHYRALYEAHVAASKGPHACTF